MEKRSYLEWRKFVHCQNLFVHNHNHKGWSSVKYSSSNSGKHFVPFLDRTFSSSHWYRLRYQCFGLQVLHFGADFFLLFYWFWLVLHNLFLIQDTLKQQFTSTIGLKLQSIWSTKYSWKHIDESKVLHAVCTKQNFDRLLGSCTLNEIFLKNLFQIFVVLVPFESKLVNYSIRCQEFLKAFMKLMFCKFTCRSLLKRIRHKISSRTYWGSYYWPIFTQYVAK